MTVNEFIESMAKAGFEFRFRATNGEITILGEAVKDAEGNVNVTKRKVATYEQSKAEIKRILNK